MPGRRSHSTNRTKTNKQNLSRSFKRWGYKHKTPRARLNPVGQNDQDEFVMFRQSLDEHLAVAEQERDEQIDKAASAMHLAVGSASGFQAKQVG